MAALFVVRERNPLTLATVALSTFVGPLSWNAVLHSAGGKDFFHDAPVALFPVSWQDCGSGVWTLAVASVVLGLTQSSPRRVVVLAAVTAVVAWLTDIYLY